MKKSSRPIHLVMLCYMSILCLGSFAIGEEKPAAPPLSSPGSTTLPSGRGKAKIPYSSLALNLEYVGPAVQEKDWICWCVSPVEDDAGKTHLFASRWPRSEGVGGWTSEKAEIAHYVGDRPEGPFHYVDTVTKGQGKGSGAWDEWGVHNPRIKRFGDRYALIHHGLSKQKKADGSPIQMTNVGLLLADSPNGPWKRTAGKDGQIIQVPESSINRPNCTEIWVTNPDIVQVGSKYRVYAMCWLTGWFKENKEQWYMWESDKLEGPYVMREQPVTETKGYTEDISVFTMNNKVYMLMDDNHGANTGVFGSTMLLESDDGLFFPMSRAKIGPGYLTDYASPDVPKVRSIGAVEPKFERPAVLLRNGKPAYFYAPSRANITGNDLHENYVLRVCDSSRADLVSRFAPAERLWDGIMPCTYETLDKEWCEVRKPGPVLDRFVHEVSVPTFAVYHPAREKNSGAAVVVCPGGGYGGLSVDTEGHEVARWFCERGITTVVLKYRLPQWKEMLGTEPWPLADAHQVIRIIRSRAREWGVDPGRVGIMGFSAGAHLAAWSGLYSDPGNPAAPAPIQRMSSRPDFEVLVYPAMSMLGQGAPECSPLFKGWPATVFAKADMPPTFMVYYDNDGNWSPGAREFEAAAIACKAPLTVSRFEKGDHGSGLGTGTPAAKWPEQALQWMTRLQPAKPKTAGN
jgi:acetyl esterase/lipase